MLEAGAERCVGRVPPIPAPTRAGSGGGGAAAGVGGSPSSDASDHGPRLHPIRRMTATGQEAMVEPVAWAASRGDRADWGGPLGARERLQQVLGSLCKSLGSGRAQQGTDWGSGLEGGGENVQASPSSCTVHKVFGVQGSKVGGPWGDCMGEPSHCKPGWALEQPRREKQPALQGPLS